MLEMKRNSHTWGGRSKAEDCAGSAVQFREDCLCSGSELGSGSEKTKRTGTIAPVLCSDRQMAQLHMPVGWRGTPAADGSRQRRLAPQRQPLQLVVSSRRRSHPHNQRSG